MDDRSVLADTEVHALPSRAVGDAFKIFVGHCPVRGDDAPPSVLYVTDGNGLFGATVDAVRSMQLARHLPNLLVVAIGYPRGALADTIDVRTRDLTPTVDPAFAAAVPGQPEWGGAPAFLAFIRDELKPWVHERFGVDPDRSAYFGHSFGGLFGCYALLTAPATFERYVLGSPSLWWDRGTIFDLEARFAAANDDLPARVALGIGAHETNEGRQREAERMPADARAETARLWIDMVADMQRFVERLTMRRYPSLRLDAQVFPEEFHVTVPVLNLTRGLRCVFEAPI